MQHHELLEWSCFPYYIENLLPVFCRNKVRVIRTNQLCFCLFLFLKNFLMCDFYLFFWWNGFLKFCNYFYLCWLNISDHHRISRGRSIFVGSQRLLSCIKRWPWDLRLRPPTFPGLEIGKFSSGNVLGVGCFEPQKTPPKFIKAPCLPEEKNEVSNIFQRKKTGTNPVAPNPTKPLGSSTLWFARWSVGCEVEAMLPEEMMPEGLGVKWASGEWVNF